MKVFDEKLSVRETEALVKRMLEPPKQQRRANSVLLRMQYMRVWKKNESIMGTRVQIHRKKMTKVN